MTTLVVNPGASLTNHCRVMYDNLLENGTVVASSEDADFPVENCFDWVTSDFFRPAAAGTTYITLTLTDADSANYLAFYGQDIWEHTGTIKLQYDDGSGWTDASDAITPTSSAPRVVFFDKKTASSWRLVITCNVVFNIGVIAFGEYLALPYGMYLGWTPPLLARNNQYINNVSDGGNFLGRSYISKGVRLDLVLQYVTDEWARSTWLPFVKHMEQKPFFFAPNVSDYATEVALVWAEGDIQPPTHTHYGYMGTTVSLRGVVE